MPDYLGLLFLHLEKFLLSFSFYLCSLFFSQKFHRMAEGCLGVMNLLVGVLSVLVWDILEVHLMHYDDEMTIPEVETTV